MSRKPGSRKPEEIEDDIDAIRARMEKRLQDLGQALDPMQIFGQVTGTQNTTGAETIGALVETAKRNPISAALLGAGMLGLFYSNRQAPRDAELHNNEASAPLMSDDPAERMAARIDQLEAELRQARDDAKLQVETAKAQVKGKAAAAKNAVENVNETMGDSYDRAKERASSLLDDGRESAVSAARRAPQRAKVQTEIIADWVKENPAPAGFMALAVGAVISSLFTARKASSRSEAGRGLYEEASNSVGASSTTAPVPSAKAPKRASAKRKTTAKRATKAASTEAAAKNARTTKAKPAKASSKRLNGSKESERATVVLDKHERPTTSPSNG